MTTEALHQLLDVVPANVLNKVLAERGYEPAQQKDQKEAFMLALAEFEANNKFMTVEECADYLGIKSNQTVISLIRKNEIKAIQTGTVYRIPKIQFLDCFLSEKIKSKYINK